jgi:hypothetical protein
MRLRLGLYVARGLRYRLAYGGNTHVLMNVADWCDVW